MSTASEAGLDAAINTVEEEWQPAAEQCAEARDAEDCAGIGIEVGKSAVTVYVSVAAGSACGGVAGPLAAAGCAYVAGVLTDWALDEVVPAIAEFFGGLFGRKKEPPRLIEPAHKEPWELPEETFQYRINPIRTDPPGAWRFADANQMERDIRNSVVALQNLWAEYDLGPPEAYTVNDVLRRLVTLRGAPLSATRENVYVYRTRPDRRRFEQWLSFPEPRPLTFNETEFGAYRTGTGYNFTSVLERDVDGKSPPNMPHMVRPDYWLGDAKRAYLESRGAINETNMRSWYQHAIPIWRSNFFLAVGKEAAVLAGAKTSQKLEAMIEAKSFGENIERSSDPAYQLAAWAILMRALGLPENTEPGTAAAHMEEIGLQPGVSQIWLGQCNGNLSCFEATAAREIGAAYLRRVNQLASYARIATSVGLEPDADPSAVSAAMTSYGVDPDEAAMLQARCFGDAECFEGAVMERVTATKATKRRRLVIGLGVAGAVGVTLYGTLRARSS